MPAEMLEPIDQSAIVVNLTDTFLNWVNFTDDSPNMTLQSINDENHVYLIPEYENDKELESYLKKNYLVIFENELMAWWTDPDGWPKKRTYTLFKEFFHIEKNSMVFEI